MRRAVGASLIVHPWVLVGVSACVGVDGLAASPQPDAAPPPLDAAAGASDAGSGGPPGASDARTDGADASARCNPASPFGAPRLVPGVSTSDGEFSARLTPDELTIYFARWDSPTGYRIYTATRPSVGAEFSNTVQLVETNVDLRNAYPSPSDDGLSLYFWVQILEGSEIDATYVITRASLGAAWSAPRQVGQFGGAPYVLGTQAAVYGGATSKIGRFALPSGAREAVLDGPFSDPVPSRDELTLFVSNFGSDPSLSNPAYVARRSMTAAPFADAAPLGDFDAGHADAPSWLSPDGCVLYLTRGGDIYVAQRSP